MKLAIVADDLTGALDSSVAFAERGLKVVCALSLSQLPASMDSGADVVAVSTGSRELSQSEAVLRIEQVLTMLDAHQQGEEVRIFKKVDSRLKGHIGAEVRALKHPFDKIVVCPAIPRLGRFVKDGLLVGVGVDEPIDVAATVGLPAACSIEADGQEAIEAAIAGLDDDMLFVGAAGLAEALAAQMAPGASLQKMEPPAAPALFAIGSRDPVTLAQLECFDILAAPNGAVPDPADWHGDVKVIQMTPGESVISGQQAGDLFADGISNWIAKTRPRTFLGCGGESAAAICARLNIGILQVLGEVLPGLPMSRSCNDGDRLFIITKSGGFGPKDTLVNLASKLVKY
ncbi:four-carbon acid sugar kinase family protein [uncultured Cohaesibacter sp.]|uniref:four-carbon acid sugar kinase family protein n=1 Tax=uncultured Cohaesibacter sp. TaxID=1002546 RepID=UPI0029C6D10F|nr:four-carbon acid sugar kinase family protein [uncultured Cohaesibacter sp.]